MVTLVGCDYNQLNMHTPVLNLNSLSGSIWVSIPKAISKLTLYEIHDLSKQDAREVNFFGKIHQDFDHPWLNIPLEILDMKSGKHVYKLVFFNQRTGDFSNVFISYVSQDDNPRTPYVYMKDRGNASVEANKWKDGKYSSDFYDKLRKHVEETYGYDPMMYAGGNYCQTCTVFDCNNCPYANR